MSDAVIALVGVAVGALVTVFGSIAGGLFTHRSERRERIRGLLATLHRLAGSLDLYVDAHRQHVKGPVAPATLAGVRAQAMQAYTGASEPLGLLEMEPHPGATAVSATFQRMIAAALVVDAMTTMYTSMSELVPEAKVAEWLAEYDKERAAFRQQSRELWADLEPIWRWRRQRIETGSLER